CLAKPLIYCGCAVLLKAIGEFNMELNYELIGARIKKIRKSKKMTQDRLSELSSISPQHLSQIESAKTKLSLPTLVNICNALEVTADRILCDVLKAETPEEINADIAEVFNGCSADETFLMLDVANSLKQSLRIKKIGAEYE
ncbi:MAG: helix-turn-helix domain-containing protein, partial [Oscillospiraceae bacterium]